MGSSGQRGPDAAGHSNYPECLLEQGHAAQHRTNNKKKSTIEPLPPVYKNARGLILFNRCYENLIHLQDYLLVAARPVVGRAGSRNNVKIFDAK